MSYILKKSHHTASDIYWETSSIRGFEYKPHHRNHVLFFLKSLYNLFANCRARVRDEKELEELIRKIYSPAEQLEHYLLDKELLALLSSCLCWGVEQNKDVPCNLKKLPCSSNIFSLFCTYL